MTQRCPPQLALQAGPSNHFSALPSEVLNQVGHYLSKTDRNNLTRAVPGLQYGGAALWRDDLIYDHMVPRSLQHDACESRAAAGGQQQEQAWVQLWRRLRRGAKASKHSLPTAQVQATQVGCVRMSVLHDIQSVIPLPDSREVLTIGRMPTADARQVGALRRGRVFSLAPRTQRAATTRVAENSAVWPHDEIAVSSQWRRPKTLFSAGCNGLMAVVDPHDELTIWQYDHHVLVPLPFQNPEFHITATQAAFTRVGQAPRAIFYGNYAYGRDGASCEEEDFRLHGINICPPGVLSHVPYLEMVQNTASAPPVYAGQRAAPDSFGARHLGVDEQDKAVLLVGDRGEVMVQPQPFAGARAVLGQFRPSQGYHTACASTCNNAVALADDSGRVQVLRRSDKQLTAIWRWPKPRPIKQLALNVDGSRLGLLREDNLLDVWSIAPRGEGSLTSAGRLLCRISFGGQPITRFDFSPYCHALLITLPGATRLVLPMHKQFVIELPDLRGTGVFVPGLLRIVGVHDAALVDIDLSAPPAAA